MDTSRSDDRGHFLASVDHDLRVSGLERVPSSMAPDAPLVIAIPGGSYTSRYFDIPGCSLLERACAVGIPAIAVDRPGYGATTPLAQATIVENARQLDRAMAHLWRQRGSGRTAGVVLVGHSIGAAVAVALAAHRPQWPLLGIAISGVGLTPPPGVVAAWSSLPETGNVSLPPEAKDAFMFGPSWTFDPSVPVRTRAADAPTPRTELLDIVGAWPSKFAALAAEVAVPVHYRQAEFDPLWVVDDAEIGRFAASFTGASFVDARLFAASGHCIDFHRLGAQLHLEQLAFALRCAVTRP